MIKARKPSYLHFDKATYAWKPDVDYRKNPNAYRVGKGEQGVLICEPYKSELSPLWQFATPATATSSARKILNKFRWYLKRNDFVGADLARKYLQMGYTRSRRYANYKGGKKYDKANGYEPRERGKGDPEKAESAAIFYAAWREAEATEKYAAMKQDWKRRFG